MGASITTHADLGDFEHGGPSKHPKRANRSA